MSDDQLRFGLTEKLEYAYQISILAENLEYAMTILTRDGLYMRHLVVAVARSWAMRIVSEATKTESVLRPLIDKFQSMEDACNQQEDDDEEDIELLRVNIAHVNDIREKLREMGIVGRKTLKSMWEAVDKAAYEYLHRKWTRRLIKLDSRYNKLRDAAHLSLAEVKATARYHPSTGMDSVVSDKKRKLNSE